jgi:DNA-directed RNA polymerase subunit RPC12/RpoP
MNKIVEALLAFVGVCLLLLGVIFIIAAEMETLLVGGVMILASIGIFAYIYKLGKIEAAKPTLVSQTFNVKMDGSGEFEKRELKCRSCGAPLTEKSLKIVQGGIMVNCSYCGAVYAYEEAPKW